MSFSIKSTHVFVDIAQAIPEPEPTYTHISTPSTSSTTEPRETRLYPNMGSINTTGSVGGMTIHNNPTSMEDAF